MSKARIKTRTEVREGFKRAGITIRQWASDNKFNERIVYAVISGENKGNYGKAHEVAVSLGLKEASVESY